MPINLRVMSGEGSIEDMLEQHNNKSITTTYGSELLVKYTTV